MTIGVLIVATLFVTLALVLVQTSSYKEGRENGYRAGHADGFLDCFEEWQESLASKHPSAGAGKSEPDSGESE